MIHHGSPLRLLEEKVRRAEQELTAGKAHLQKMMTEKTAAEKSVSVLRIDLKEVITQRQTDREIMCLHVCDLLVGCSENRGAGSID